MNQAFKERLKSAAPLRLDHYIEACLWDRDYGYYRRDKVFGEEGDFITSPEISQIFGEVIAMWAILSWQEMGQPERFTLLEMGAGRGVLMRDLLNAAQLAPAFLEAADIHILEQSEARREEQEGAIRAPITFLDNLDLPPQPAIIISNEFFDALPIRQFRQDGGGWLEAFVDENLTKNWQPCPRPPLALAPYGAREGIIELNESSIAIMKNLGAHIRMNGGRILTIDYGEFDGVGDSFQAVKSHQKVNPFEAPGEADLTAHVRFRDLAEAAELDCDFMKQGEFLNHFGGAERLAQLTTQNPNLAAELESGYHRLTAQSEMGELFKVLIQKA